MNISKIFVAALVATAIGAAAQNPDRDDKTQMGNDDGVKAFNSNMDTNFTPPANNGGGKPGGGKPGNGSAPASIPADKKAAIVVSGITGVVQYTDADGKVVTVKDGDSIPSGAKIVVVSGVVTVKSGGLTVTAKQGDAFSVAAGGSGLTVAVTAGAVAVVDAKGTSKPVAAGESVTAAAVVTTVVTPAVPAKPGVEAATPAVVTQTTTFVFSPAQESCSNTVSPSAPCN